MADGSEIEVVAAAELQCHDQPRAGDAERRPGLVARQAFLRTVHEDRRNQMHVVLQRSRRAAVVFAGQFAGLDHRVEFGGTVENAAVMVLPIARLTQTRRSSGTIVTASRRPS